MEGLQLHALLVDPRSAALQGDRVVQLRVEGEHMQLHLLAVHHLLRVQHVLYQLAVARSGRVYADDALRPVLALLVGGPLLRVLLVAVQCGESRLVSRLHGRHQDVADVIGHRLVRGRMSDDEQRAVEPALPLRTVVEPVGTPRHQRHQRPASREHRRRILAPLQPCAHVRQQREVVKHRLNLRAPAVEHAVDGLFTLGGSKCFTIHSILFTYYLPIILSRHGLHRLEHGLTGHRVCILLLLLRDAPCCRFHRLFDVLITFFDDILDPGLGLHDTQHPLPVAVEHDEQVCGQLKRLFMSVAVFAAGQLVSIPSVNNTLNIIPSPFNSCLSCLSCRFNMIRCRFNIIRCRFYLCHWFHIHSADILRPLFSIRTGHSTILRLVSRITAVISIKLKINRLSFPFAVLSSEPLVKCFIVIIE